MQSPAQWIIDWVQGKKTTPPTKEEVVYVADLFFHPDRLKYEKMTIEGEGKDGTITIVYVHNRNKTQS